MSSSIDPIGQEYNVVMFIHYCTLGNSWHSSGVNAYNLANVLSSAAVRFSHTIIWMKIHRAVFARHVNLDERTICCLVHINCIIISSSINSASHVMCDVNVCCWWGCRRLRDAKKGFRVASIVDAAVVTGIEFEKHGWGDARARSCSVLAGFGCWFLDAFEHYLVICGII